MLAGAAILGAAAAGAHESLADAMAAMSAIGETVWPSTLPAGGGSAARDADEAARLARWHERKYRVFRRMASDQLEYRRMMEAGS